MRKAYLRLALVLVVLAAILSVHVLGLGEYLSLESMKEHRASLKGLRLSISCSPPWCSSVSMCWSWVCSFRVRLL
ncbi:MAG: hypothetical protein HC945_02505 [Nitrosarchaeum sp.]|nr:hypothetical protein [Nitrosarchaeum sp.]